MHSCVYAIVSNVTVTNFLKPTTPFNKCKKKKKEPLHIPFQILISCPSVHLLLSSEHLRSGGLPLPKAAFPTWYKAPWGLLWRVRGGKEMIPSSSYHRSPFLFHDEVLY